MFRQAIDKESANSGPAVMSQIEARQSVFTCDPI